MLQTITPVILTYNEAPNIARSLQQLTWADRIVVVDSFSTDETLEILTQYPQVELFQRSFDSHANQWNYGIQQVRTEWVLSLDADYYLSDELLVEIAALPADEVVDSYCIPFKYCVFGKPLRGTLLPPREALFRKSKALYVDDGHTQLLRVNGTSAMLKSAVYHDDRKPLARWLWAQDRYAILETKKLLNTPVADLTMGDRLRRAIFVAPLIVLIYCLIVRQGVRDGAAGWYYAFQRVLAEILLSIRLLEAQCQQK
jgi:glycosyltransferase involved in cell wall biosynthesis